MNLLPKLFIKDYLNYRDAGVRRAYGNLCGSVGIIVNLSICILKTVLGFIVGSIAIIADGINNFTDVGSSVITLVGFRLSARPGDKEHPYGHERIEYITALIVALCIVAVGALLLGSSVEKLIEFETTQAKGVIAYVTIAVLGISIPMKLGLGFFNRRYARLIDSPALEAAGTDCFTDCLATGAALMALTISIFNPNAFFDGAAGLLVSGYIIYSGIKLVRETVSPLIGEVPRPEFIRDVRNRVLSYDGILGIHDLVIHSYGPKKIFITLHAEVDSKVDINTSHDIIDNIESDFRIKDRINLVIHMDPIDIDDQEVIDLRRQVAVILGKIDPKLRFHDLRIVRGTTHTNVIFDVVRPFGCLLSEETIEKETEIRLREINRDYRLVIVFDTDYTGGENYE